MNIARKEIGIREVAGLKHNDRILMYHSATRLKATTDEVPWCASFVSWVLEQAGLPSAKSAWSRSYLEWGTELAWPAYGAIVVLRRGDDDKKGHVGFAYNWTQRTVHILGGNQGNE